MSKQQGGVVVYQRNSVAINALVAFSRQALVPDPQNPGLLLWTEHLTLVYLDPAAASAAPTGEQLRNSIKVQADVPPLAEGAVNGWKEVANLTQQLTAEEAIAVRTIPTAADLDAHADEQKAKEATEGAVVDENILSAAELDAVAAHAEEKTA